jgi:hypothetical protein
VPILPLLEVMDRKSPAEAPFTPHLTLEDTETTVASLLHTLLTPDTDHTSARLSQTPLPRLPSRYSSLESWLVHLTSRIVLLLMSILQMGKTHPTRMNEVDWLA